LNNTWSVSTDYKAPCYVVFSTSLLPRPQAQVALSAPYCWHTRSLCSSHSV